MNSSIHLIIHHKLLQRKTFLSTLYYVLKTSLVQSNKMGQTGNRTKYAPLLYIESKSERLRSLEELVLPEELKKEEVEDGNNDPTEVISLFST